MLFSLAASRIFNGHPCRKMHMTKPTLTFHKCFANGVMGVSNGTKFIPGLMKIGKLIQKGGGGERHTHTNMHAQAHTARSDLPNLLLRRKGR
jgi:hypothetical protein